MPTIVLGLACLRCAIDANATEANHHNRRLADSAARTLKSSKSRLAPANRKPLGQTANPQPESSEVHPPTIDRETFLEITAASGMDSDVVPSDEIPAQWYRRISGSPANEPSQTPRGQIVIRETEPHQAGIPSQQTEGDADEKRAGRNNSEKRQNSVVFPKVTLLQPTASNSTESTSDQPAELARERQTENSAFAVPFWIQNSEQTSQINYPTGSPETVASPASIFSNTNGSNRHRRNALKKLTQRMTPANGISPQCDPSMNFYNDFSPTPIANESMYHDEHREQWVYDHHYDVPTQRPWVEWGRVFYGDGITPRGKLVWSHQPRASGVLRLRRFQVRDHRWQECSRPYGQLGKPAEPRHGLEKPTRSTCMLSSAPSKTRDSSRGLNWLTVICSTGRKSTSHHSLATLKATLVQSWVD